MSNSTDNKSIVSDLRNCSVDSKSRSVDWGAILGEEMEGFRSFEALECETCDLVHVVSGLGGEECCSDLQSEIEDEDGDEVRNECDGVLYPSGPQMNHFYPCEFVGLSVEDAALAIASLPLCVIEMEDGETGFALQGGGMDLSWEICDAYIRCGYLPPLQYCDLPRMAGQAKHPRCQLILAACQRSTEIAEGWAHRKGEELARMAAEYKSSNAA